MKETGTNKKVGVGKQVFQQMKQEIIEQKWEPGIRLPSEQDLCKKYGVSRVTIRDALLRLNTLGLTETFLGDGTYVKKPDASSNINNLIPIMYLEHDLDSILEFRKVVESGACAIAAQKAVKKDITHLKRLLKKMIALQNDLGALAMVDLEFHFAIAQISGNNLFIKTYEIISDVYACHMTSVVNAMGGDLGLHYHEKIVQAIENRDPEAARDIMYEHICKNAEFFMS